MNRPDNTEAKMARADLFKLAQYSFKLFKMINENQELEGWVQAKITKSADYIASVYHYMEYELKVSEYGDHLESAEMYSESVRRVFEQKLLEAKKMAEVAKAKAKKDYDGDGKVEAPKDEVWGSRAKAAAKSGKPFKEEADRKPAKKSEREVELPSGAKVKATKVQGWQSQKADKDADKERKSNDKVKEAMAPMNPDGATAPPKKDPKTGRYPKVTSGPNKGKEWSPNTPGPTNPAMKEAAKPDFLDMDKDGNKKEPMKKAVADKKAGPKKGVNPFAKVKEAADKCNHTAKGKKCPVHGLKECGSSMYEGDKFDPLKHVKNPTKGEKDAAKDVKRGSYGDRAAMLKSAEKDGRLKG